MHEMIKVNCACQNVRVVCVLSVAALGEVNLIDDISTLMSIICQKFSSFSKEMYWNLCPFSCIEV